jgi:hypothetical protein
LLEEMDQENPGEMERVDSLMHSSIDTDQLIVFEANLIEDCAEQGKGNSQTIELALFKIKSYAEDNSKKVGEARNLIREMGEYVLEE